MTTTRAYLDAIKDALEKRIASAEPVRDDEVIAYALVVIAKQLVTKG